jgi:hypothetical protein
MEPIRVPAPPKEAFNKHRRMSDLIKAQISHLKHLENKLPEEIRGALPQHHLVTEDDAARYIAPMTKLLCSMSTEATTSSKKPASKTRQRTAIRSAKGMSLAAVAEKTTKKPRTKGKSSTGAKTSAKSKRASSSAASKRKK